MFFIKILVVLVGIAAALYLGWLAFRPSRDADRKNPGIRLGLLGVAVLILLFAILLQAGFGTVSAGYRGVVLRWGGTTDRILPEGFYIVMPIVDSVQLMPTQVAAYTSEVSAASQDLQDIRTQVTINYSLEAEKVGWIWQNLRDQWEQRVMSPAVQESVKAVTAKFPATELITQRATVKQQVEEKLVARLEQYGIRVSAVSLTDFSFSPEFSAAIEAKMVASQKAQEAEYKLLQVKIEADQKIAEAEGKAKALQIESEALMTNPQILTMRMIEKWDGIMPQVLMGDQGALPVFDILKATTP